MPDSSSSTLIEHFNGTAWSVVPSPSPGNFTGLSSVTTVQRGQQRVGRRL